MSAAPAQQSASPTTPGDADPGPRRIALLGNPNTGKTTLFNRLCGLRHRTGNFPGTTQEARTGFLRAIDSAHREGELIDLPGIYSLELEQNEADICRRVLAGTLAMAGQPASAPEAVCIVIDATNLARNLVLVGEVLRRRLPTVIALNMIDLARARGLRIDAEALATALGCQVVACNARGGEGADALRAALAEATLPNITPPGTQEGLESWADALCAQVAGSHSPDAAEVHASHTDLTDRLDRAFTHPVLGLVCFGAIMFGLFWTIFSLAELPMGIIESVFGLAGEIVGGVLGEGILSEFVVGGVISGLAGVLVFLPQICLLFFLISILEDTGYLARAAFVMNRFLAPFGLSGHAFMPLLSSHACAIPGVMACRAIPDRRERIAAILSAPFMSCSARIPVYVLLIVVLFPGSPTRQAIAFSACYVVGIFAGLLSALIARRTLLKGPARPMALELPTYKLPSLRTAFLSTWDRAWTFLKNAGTNILAICIVLWWLSAYPYTAPSPQVETLRAEATLFGTPGAEPVAIPSLRTDGRTPPPTVDAPDAYSAWLTDEADRLERSEALANSFAGRLGRLAQPVFAPLGFDWKLTIGVLTSFAAREVFVGTMAVVATGHDDPESEGVLADLAVATRDDGVTPIFTRPASWALLIYYVLAMQCLPTLAVTAREAGGWKWAVLQLVWMCGLAWVFGAVAHALATTLG